MLLGVGVSDAASFGGVCALGRTEWGAARVDAGSPADAAGVQQGDDIVAAAGHPVRRLADLRAALERPSALHIRCLLGGAHGGGSDVTLTVRGAEGGGERDVVGVSTARRRAAGVLWSEEELRRSELALGAMWRGAGRPPSGPPELLVEGFATARLNGWMNDRETYWQGGFVMYWCARDDGEREDKWVIGSRMGFDVPIL
eukprot:gene19968-2366_t